MGSNPLPSAWQGIRRGLEERIVHEWGSPPKLAHCESTPTSSVTSGSHPTWRRKRWFWSSSTRGRVVTPTPPDFPSPNRDKPLVRDEARLAARYERLGIPVFHSWTMVPPRPQGNGASHPAKQTHVPFAEPTETRYRFFMRESLSCERRPFRLIAAAAQTAVLLDEHPLWLEAVESVLNGVGVEVVGKTTSPKEALALVEEARPDFLLAELPDSNGRMGDADLLAKARALVPDLKAIVLSAHSQSERIDGALKSGASAYVIKTAHADDLASVIRQSFGHSVYLAQTPIVPTAQPPTEFDDDGADLTRREREILRLVAEGHSNAQLAKMLWVTEQTVKFHLSNIYRKLDVSNRTEASRWAQLHGLLPETETHALSVTA